MKIQIATLAIGGMLGLAAPAQAFTVDLSGQLVDGASTNTIVVNNAQSGAVIDISFAFLYETNATTNGFGSDLLVGISHSPTESELFVGTQIASCFVSGLICDYDLAWDLTGGVFEASGSIAVTIGDATGEWLFELTSIFDNPSVPGPEGTFADGSFIEVNIAPVPLPGAAWLFAGALATLMGRRRLSA